MDSLKNKEKIKNSFISCGRGILENMSSLLKWLILAAVTGCVVGVVSSLFGRSLSFVTNFRKENAWVFYLLPVAGLVIVFIYEKIGKRDGGTNQLFSAIRDENQVAFRSAPLIFVSTVLTHLTGASAGREGAALQLGGSIANKLGSLFPLDEEDRRVMIMCGMSSGFAALFGTPIAASVFSLEVVCVGSMYYSALLPCMVASLIAKGVAQSLGVHAESFHVMEIPEFNLANGVKMGIIALACSAVSILFCLALKGVGKVYGKYLKNKYIRILAASALIIGITLLLGTTDYMGAGTDLIVRAVEEGKSAPLAFLWKLILTAITMKAGFKGGEIVPSFTIGATLGCVLGGVLGLSPSICAAAGMTAVFCGVTNCPLASALIAFELFGFEGASFYVLAVAISYATSGYFSLYKVQTVKYSKYKLQKISRK